MKLYLGVNDIYYGTMKEAGKGHTLEKVPVSKYELIDYLNVLKHSEPTRDEIVYSNTPEMQAKAREIGCDVASQSLQVDQDFDNLPLARQLDLAARAMENARAKL